MPKVIRLYGVNIDVWLAVLLGIEIRASLQNLFGLQTDDWLVVQLIDKKLVFRFGG